MIIYRVDIVVSHSEMEFTIVNFRFILKYDVIKYE